MALYVASHYKVIKITEGNKPGVMHSSYYKSEIF